MSQILVVIASLCSVFISFYLGQRSTNIATRNEQLKNRYFKFYIPFFVKLLKTSNVDFEYVISFFGIDFVAFLLDSIQFMSKDSAKFVGDLSKYGQDFEIYNIEYLLDPHKEITNEIRLSHENKVATANLIFKKFVESCMAESESIAKKLKLEPVTSNIF